MNRITLLSLLDPNLRQRLGMPTDDAVLKVEVFFHRGRDLDFRVTPAVDREVIEILRRRTYDLAIGLDGSPVGLDSKITLTYQLGQVDVDASSDIPGAFVETLQRTLRPLVTTLLGELAYVLDTLVSVDALRSMVVNQMIETLSERVGERQDGLYRLSWAPRLICSVHGELPDDIKDLLRDAPGPIQDLLSALGAGGLERDDEPQDEDVLPIKIGVDKHASFAPFIERLVTAAVNRVIRDERGAVFEATMQRHISYLQAEFGHDLAVDIQVHSLREPDPVDEPDETDLDPDDETLLVPETDGLAAAPVTGSGAEPSVEAPALEPIADAVEVDTAPSVDANADGDRTHLGPLGNGQSAAEPVEPPAAQAK